MLTPKTTSENSLNDLLGKGGIFEEDFLPVLIRFKKHIYSYTANIKQVFKMIEINPLH